MLLSPACKVLFLCYNEAMDERYSRTALLLGEEGIERLKTLCVAVVGLGAVGGFAAEMLARAGTGTIRLIDFDRFETSNLNPRTTENRSGCRTHCGNRTRLPNGNPHPVFFERECRRCTGSPSRRSYRRHRLVGSESRFNRRVCAAAYSYLFVNGRRIKNRCRRHPHR